LRPCVSVAADRVDAARGDARSEPSGGRHRAWNHDAHGADGSLRAAPVYRTPRRRYRRNLRESLKFTGNVTDIGWSAPSRLGPTTCGSFKIACHYDTRRPSRMVHDSPATASASPWGGRVEGNRTGCGGCRRRRRWAVHHSRHWNHGTRTNLERPFFRVGDELGGHIVDGHVDAIAESSPADDLDTWRASHSGPPPQLSPLHRPQRDRRGSTVSITVNEVEGAPASRC